MAFKDLRRGTATDKVLCDEAFDIAKNPKYGGYPIFLQKLFLMVLLKAKLCQTKNQLEGYISQLLKNLKKKYLES